MTTQSEVESIKEQLEEYIRTSENLHNNQTKRLKRTISHLHDEKYQLELMLQLSRETNQHQMQYIKTLQKKNRDQGLVLTVTFVGFFLFILLEVLFS